ncbi:MAG: HEAT repeat domain-containing protein [Planctomycetes bacterium]|nr:HEAT repeat domain-containing protein [Planctomycetota bacterium]
MNFRFPISNSSASASLRSIVGCLLACALFYAQAHTLSAQDARVSEDEQVQSAIKKAVAKLKKNVATLSAGESALVTMALLKSGQSADSPEIKAALNLIVDRCKGDEFKPGNHHVYEAGVSIMALANADPVKYRPQIQTIVKFLIDNQQENGGWFYAKPAHSTDGDTSITQYAVLGLWEATRSGVPVPRRIWDRVAEWHLKFQNEDGSFSYHPVQGSFAFGNGGTLTMTVAGTGSLHVARLYLYPDAKDLEELKKKGLKNGKRFGILEPVDPKSGDSSVDPEKAVAAADAAYRPTTRLAAIDKGIKAGTQWLADRFTIEPKAGHDIYYLYGIERLMALANVTNFAGRDWYAEGSAHLCRIQDQTGGWNDNCGNEPATALGLLFLGKATSKMLGRKPPRPVEKKFGGGLLVGGRGLPENLETLEAGQQGVQVRKLKGPVDELLAELEKADSQQVEAAQSGLVEKIATEDPEALIGQTNRLLKLVTDKRVEVRRTVFWALGRTNDLQVVPRLIEGLQDSEPACVIEARNALQFISKKLDAHEPPDEFDATQRAAAVLFWKKWYLGVRDYAERDDLTELPPK